MILQVVPDTRQLVRDTDAMAHQLVPRSDARQQQQLRRLEGAGRQDYGTARRDAHLVLAAAADDAGRAPAIEGDL